MLFTNGCGDRRSSSVPISKGGSLDLTKCLSKLVFKTPESSKNALSGELPPVCKTFGRFWKELNVVQLGYSYHLPHLETCHATPDLTAFPCSSIPRKPVLQYMSYTNRHVVICGKRSNGIAVLHLPPGMLFISVQDFRIQLKGIWWQLRDTGAPTVCTIAFKFVGGIEPIPAAYAHVVKNNFTFTPCFPMNVPIGRIIRLSLHMTDKSMAPSTNSKT